MLLDNQWINEEIKEITRKYLEANEKKKYNFPKSVKHRRNSSKSEICSDIGLSQKAFINITYHLKKFFKKDEQSLKPAKGKK